MRETPQNGCSQVVSSPERGHGATVVVLQPLQGSSQTGFSRERQGSGDHLVHHKPNA